MTDPLQANDDVRHPVLDAAVENTLSKVLARWVLPGLVAALIAVVVWIGQGALAQIREQGMDLRAQSNDIAQVKSDVRVMATRLDEGVIRQVNQNTQRVQDIERRVQILERTVRTP